MLCYIVNIANITIKIKIFKRQFCNIVNIRDITTVHWFGFGHIKTGLVEVGVGASVLDLNSGQAGVGGILRSITSE